MVALPPLSSSIGAVRASVFSDLASHIAARAKLGGDLIPLHIGDTHLAPPDGATFASAAQGTRDELYAYGAIASMEALRAACASRLLSSGFGPRVIDPNRDVLIGCGATHALFCAIRAIVSPGDEVLVAAPYWPLSVGIIRAAGGLPIEVDVPDAANGPEALAEAFARATTSRTCAIYIISPNNPDGRVFSKEELAALAELCRERNLWAISDEVYADYTYGAAHVSLAQEEGMSERTISAYSLSKSHALAGARVGYVIAPARVVDEARKVSTHTVFNVPVISQKLAALAMRDDGDFVVNARSTYASARGHVLDALARLPVETREPRGGSYVFINFANVLGGRALTELLAVAIEHGVLLAPGDAFGASYATWARLCFTAKPVDDVLEGIARLARAIERFRAL